MIINPYTILNLSPNASIDDVKKAFKNIALKSHPDKLNDIKDPIEKNKRIVRYYYFTTFFLCHSKGISL